MPLVQNGRVASALRYIDPDGIEHQVVQVRLGELMVWDGTTPALVQVTRARITLAARVPVVAGEQRQTVVRSAGYLEVASPVVAAAANVYLPTVSMTATGREASLSAGAVVTPAIPTATMQVHNIAAGAAEAGDVYLTLTTATLTAHPPVVSVPATVELTTAQAFLEGKTVGAAGLAQVTPTAATMSAAAAPPALTAGQNLTLTRATLTGDAIVPVVSAGANVTPTGATASMAAIAPQVVTTVPMGMEKNASTQVLDNGAYTVITGWAVRTGYPNTVLSGNGMALNGGTYSSIAIQVRFSNSSETTLRVYRGSTLIHQGAQTGEVTNVTATLTNVSWPTNGEILTVQALRSDTTAYRTVSAGANTYVIATPA